MQCLGCRKSLALLRFHVKHRIPISEVEVRAHIRLVGTRTLDQPHSAVLVGRHTRLSRLGVLPGSAINSPRSMMLLV